MKAFLHEVLAAIEEGPGIYFAPVVGAATETRMIAHARNAVLNSAQWLTGEQMSHFCMSGIGWGTLMSQPPRSICTSLIRWMAIWCSLTRMSWIVFLGAILKTKKTFDASPPLQVTTAPNLDDVTSLVIPIPESSSSIRSIDLTPWLGHRIDEWVWAGASLLRALLAGSKVTTRTVVNYWMDGLRNFFDFLVSAGVSCQPDSLNPKHIQHYLAWLKDHNNWGRTTQVNCYNFTKSIRYRLRSLARRVSDQRVTGLALVDRDECLMMARANDQIGLPVAEPFTCSNHGRALLD